MRLHEWAFATELAPARSGGWRANADSAVVDEGRPRAGVSELRRRSPRWPRPPRVRRDSGHERVGRGRDVVAVVGHRELEPALAVATVVAEVAGGEHADEVG